MKSLMPIITTTSLTKKYQQFMLLMAHITRRMLYQMNTLALDEVKSSGTLKFLESDELKAAIQRYASLGSGLKLREQREFSYIDRMLDPISTKNFEFNFNRAAGDNFKIKGNKIVVNSANSCQSKNYEKRSARLG